jgi:hypothetical protein
LARGRETLPPSSFHRHHPPCAIPAFPTDETAGGTRFISPPWTLSDYAANRVAGLPWPPSVGWDRRSVEETALGTKLRGELTWCQQRYLRITDRCGSRAVVGRERRAEGLLLPSCSPVGAGFLEQPSASRPTWGLRIASRSSQKAIEASSLKDSIGTTARFLRGSNKTSPDLSLLWCS